MPRIAIIERDKCLKEKCGYVCQKVCPGVLMGDETVTVDAEGYPVISEILCTGCGICPKKCPAKCIYIINLAEEKGKLMHQYGVNTFRIYGMPLPQQGITGLVGKNGIGKTTALSILAGNILPNLGNFKNPPLLEKILPELTKPEAKYFKEMQGKEIKVALKPQNVDKIPAVVKGKVSSLLEKADERGALGEAIALFSLEKVLSKNLNEISGGELQRVAIAACWCKNADIYYFDEPASYLDISQRLRVAKALKKLGEEKKVIVVEHDLALFDYVSDYVYVFFGQEHAYGMVSGLKSTRAGINQYLHGFLNEENIRFRENEIKFQKGAAVSRKGHVKFEYPSFEKKFDGFLFASDEGKINKGEVIGIVGENAIGKTLFVKMLAGALKSDNENKMEQKISVSYKPQYVKAQEGVTALELFSQYKINGAFFEEAQRRLCVAPLMDKMLNTLSGGELQRVSIVLALSQEADLYLLDEPSAFLDVEQRLQFAQLVQSLIENSGKCAFVVDHDLVLIDAISSRIMHFEGKPAVNGHASAPNEKKEGLNKFLKGLGITLRRDVDTQRPRINKPDSVMDRKQKEAGEYYYYDSEKK